MKRLDVLVLAALLVVAAFFRLSSLDWDDGTHQHPDERFLTDLASQVRLPPSPAAYFDTARSPLNPYHYGDRYAYGQLPLTLTRIGGEATGLTGYDSIYLVGRALSALADLLTIVFAWLLARRIFETRTAHLSAAFLLAGVLPIQLSHFFAVDTFATCFAAGAIYFGQRTWDRESVLDAGVAGVCVGLAAASKVSAFILLPALFVALLVPRAGRWHRDHLLDAATLFAVVGLGTLLAFRVAEPYAFAGPAPWSLLPSQQWLADKVYWAEISSGGVDVPYMLQWTGTAPYLFVLQSIVLWGLGPALGLASLIALVVATWRLIRDRPDSRASVLLVAWTLINLAYFGGQFAKFMRYLLPVYFGLAILAAALLVRLVTSGSRTVSAIGRVGTVGVLVATFGWAVAFSQIYAAPHSRIQASSWIYDHIPPGSVLATEHWDDRLPLFLPGREAWAYQYAELKLYDAETPAKRDQLATALDRADYVILASRRLVDSIPRVPERYPLATRYYDWLFAGDLGFDRVAVLQVSPHLGPWTIDTSRAQEDFTVYDHPTVEVWQKRADYDPARVRSLFASVALPAAGQQVQGTGASLLRPEEQAHVRESGTWTDLFDASSPVNRFQPLAVLLWLLVAEVVALAAWPLLWRTVTWLPDRGFGVSKILGLTLVAYLAWLLASLKVVPFGRGSLLGALAVVVASSAFVGWRARRDLLAWLRAERRLLLAVEGVFLAGFALFLLIRAVNPDLWHPSFGGEKPMNFAYLNAVVRSDYFPPYDPWFAGGAINYYYYGFVLVAALVKVTGILPQIAFNLSHPLFFGMLAAGSFSLAFGLVRPLAAEVRRGPSYLAGIAAVLLVAILGNLDAGLQVLDRLWQIGGEASPTWGGAARLAAGLVAVIGGHHFPPLDFWRSTRIIGPEDPTPITEFPYFTFLYGDLHAHQLALPLTVAALALAIQLLLSARERPTRVAWGALGWSALTVATIRPTNTWDFPTYAALTVAALGVGYLPGLLERRRAALLAAGASIVVWGVLAQGLFLPYLQRYELFYTGVDPATARTPLSQYLVIHGLPLFLIGSFLAWQAWRWASASGPRLDRLLVTPAALPASLGLAIGLGLAVAGWPTRGLVAVLLGAALALGTAGWRDGRTVALAGLIAAGAFATLVPEVVTLEGDIGRMNTVFKFTLQAWVMLAIAAAVGLAWLVRGGGRPRPPEWLRAAWGAALTILVVAAACYPLLASDSKLSLRFQPLPLTLDGMAYLSSAAYRDRDRDLDLPGDARAIVWLREQAQGTPVVLEGRAPIYRWGSRVSIYTGLPTVLGWDWHEQQQRAAYVDLIQTRAAEVQRAYDAPDPAAMDLVLAEYGVGWVYVGGLERAYYSAAGLEKLRHMPNLRLAYDEAGVQIFEVLPSGSSSSSR